MTLNDFYISQGKVLPSITERSKLYESFGLGSASDYLTSAQAGTNASMNASLLAKLQTQPTNVGEQIKQISTQVPKIQEQINALNLVNTNPIPDLGNLPLTDTKNIDTGYANAKSTSELLKQQIEKQKADEEALKQSLITQGATGTTISEMYASLAAKRPIANVQAKLTAEQEKYGVPDLLSKLQTQNIKLATLQGDITRMDTQYLNEVANIEAQPIVQGIQDRQINKIARQYQSDRAYKVADLTAESAVAQAYSGNLDAVKTLVSDAVNAYSWDFTQQVSDFDYIFKTYGDWINTLNADEKQVLTNAWDISKTNEANAREDYKTKLTLLTSAVGKGVDLGLSLNDIKTKSLNEVMEVYMREAPQFVATADETKELNNMYKLLVIQNLKEGLASGTELENTGTYGEAFNRAQSGTAFTTDDRKYNQRVMQTYLDNNDIAGTISWIEQTAVAGLGTAENSKYIGRKSLSTQLDEISGLMKEYELAGGNLNILTGNVEKVARKLGTSTDVRKAEIENRLKTALYTWRVSMTGVQFSQTEAQQYDKIFPQLTNTMDLNYALIDSLKSSSKITNDSVLKQTIGENAFKKLYQPKEPTGQGFSVIAPNGKTYLFSTKEEADRFKQSAGIK